MPICHATTHPKPLSIRVLLAEDDKLNQHLIKRLLTKQGHETVVAENGQQAVAIMQSQEIDVVVMDLDMPVMNGLEAIQIIRDRVTRHVSIIVLTSLMRDTFDDDLYAGLIDSYLTKPINAADLLQAIEDAVIAGNSSHAN